MKGETYMLEIYNNDSITIIEDLKDIITVIFVTVDDIYQKHIEATQPTAIVLLKKKFFMDLSYIP
jgi:hypothetical protein